MSDRLNLSKVKAYLRQQLNGRNSYLFCILATTILLVLGFMAPKSFECINIQPDKTKDLLNSVLTAFIGVLSVTFALSALMLSILQIANRKLSIVELVFFNSHFAPAFYFGLINIAVLSYLTLFTSASKLFGSTFFFTRVIVEEYYLLLLFLISIVIVFAKIVRYLDFSQLTADYVKSTLVLVKTEKAIRISHLN